MARPKVSITLLNNQLGQRDASEDGVAGLLMTGIATGSIALGETKLIKSLQEAVDLGLTASYDTTNTTNVYKTISDFYKEGDGPELYINIVAKTTLMAAMVNTSNNILKKLLNDAEGRIRICGVVRVPDGAYVATYTNQVDADVITAIPLAQALADEFAAAFKPVRIILDGRDFQGNTTSLGDLKTMSNNRVSVCLVTDVASSKNASVGLVLGRLAGLPVQRKISRVKDGQVGGTVGIAGAYLTNQSAKIDTLTTVAQDAVHDKGYISMMKYASKTGYFFTGDPTATSASDDYNSIARGRVIDKAITIVNEVYTEELEDDLDVDENGRIAAGVIKDYQSKIKKAIDAAMTTEDEISSCRVVIDPKQNVLSTNKLIVQLFIIPKFYSTEIAVTIGFENPANA
ncbi:DUF2586 family protein [Ohtaekwangia kribbensis]|uniref:DUF2586 family protein n=1 Tax=Ohtaekwangia kribbensis TaxID=688913 RepID=A0ABW3JUR7_9BACT